VQLTAEFTIEPFVEGDPGSHVLAGLDAVRAAGFEPQVDAFGSSIVGEVAAVAGAIESLIRAATGAGATQVSIQLRASDHAA
jgi:uncharacterized protein YqgV (UPF0045/DUF77 family)